MKKPDRWERMILKVLHDPCADIPSKEPCLSREQVARLLRAQHRSYVRMVKDERLAMYDPTTEALRERDSVLATILAKFERYAP